ncbi:hypothetical protein BU26DRAFT_516336 [Trematosphaeria pertusa]|uniref:Wax synthase domain-containing protein n=1 Tax=Trematosphaeria pertusa TaxID=390896 RepID=A0A6A6IUM9_9PLEO|nr:uncharacterized protein BU26DRAFT_516336 [Trematosphaeria pertusa]KAF2254096.1 hypothetical protein BU26DRAFT_516336 [Trematosphaeria pertusa]
MTFSDPWPRTGHDVRQHYYAQYDRDIQSGKYEPLTYPWGGIGAFVVVLYLLVPHRNRPWLRKARYLAFAWDLVVTIYTIRNVRAKDVATTLGIGLISAWSVIWIGAILICNDCQTDFQRIERTEGMFGSNSTDKKESQSGTSNSHVKSRKQSNARAQDGTANGHVEPHEHLGPGQRHGEFAWQPYPLTPFIERLDWVMDVFLNFRGAGWTWRTSATPPPPKWVQEQLHRNSPHPPRHSFRIHSSQPKVFPTRRKLLIENMKTLIAGYLILDALKALTNHDPYFWGLVDREPPEYFPAIITENPVLLRICRLMVCQFAIKWALEAIFSLAPLFFSGVLGPSILGARAEPWMYPATWGSYTFVLDMGLAGWWSAWWHQTFRFAFEQPSRKLIKVTGMNPKSPISKLLQLIIAFGLSGFLHACGSYTCHGQTRPIMGPMRFFLLQSLAIFTEALLKQSIRKSGMQRHIPRWIKRSFTFFYVYFWFYHTSGLLCDDFAKGGVWLFEPIPISIFRGLGFGVEGDGWWCWGGIGLGWHRGDRWWKSGIAL